MTDPSPNLSPPSEYINPDVVADRLWDRIAALPIPLTDAERSAAIYEILTAIREVLGGAYATVAMRPEPRAVEFMSDAITQPALSTVKVLQRDGGGVEANVSEGAEIGEPMVRRLMSQHGVPRDEIDLWAHHLVIATMPSRC